LLNLEGDSSGCRSESADQREGKQRGGEKRRAAHPEEREAEQRIQRGAEGSRAGIWAEAEQWWRKRERERDVAALEGIGIRSLMKPCQKLAHLQAPAPKFGVGHHP
jgi:hypothetical protein